MSYITRSSPRTLGKMYESLALLLFISYLINCMPEVWGVKITAIFYISAYINLYMIIPPQTKQQEINIILSQKCVKGKVFLFKFVCLRWSEERRGARISSGERRRAVWGLAGRWKEGGREGRRWCIFLSRIKSKTSGQEHNSRESSQAVGERKCLPRLLVRYVLYLTRRPRARDLSWYFTLSAFDIYSLL